MLPVGRSVIRLFTAMLNLKNGDFLRYNIALMMTHLGMIQHLLHVAVTHR